MDDREDECIQHNLILPNCHVATFYWTELGECCTRADRGRGKQRTEREEELWNDEGHV
jgi:hypothetical protein